MTLEHIKQAVRAGVVVYWCNPNYEVINPIVNLENPDKEQWLVHSKCNDYYFGLTNTDGKLVEDPEKFCMGHFKVLEKMYDTKSSGVMFEAFFSKK